MEGNRKGFVRILKEYNKDTRQKRKGFCKAPWVSMRISTNGEVFACNHNSNLVLGKLPEQSLMEIWTGRQMRAFRRNMSRLNFDRGCGFCVEDILNKRFAQASFSLFDPFTPDVMPRMIDFRLSNKCNLKCIMCSGASSSALTDRCEDPQNVIGPNFLSQLDLFIPHLETARFIGGEPLSIPFYYEIWERIIAVNPKCNIVVQTNATLINERILRLCEQGRFHFSASIDSLDTEVYRTIRVNASLPPVLKNISFFAKYAEIHSRDFVLCFCPMRINYNEIPDFIEFANGHKAHICLNRFMYPAKLAIWSLNAEKISVVRQTLEGYQAAANTLREIQNQRFLSDYIRQLEAWEMDAVRRRTDIPAEAEIDALIDHIFMESRAYPEFTAKIEEVLSRTDRKQLYHYFRPLLSNYSINLFFEGLRSMSASEVEEDILAID